ncbi:hypothetical protein HPB52_015409 [Rhipicephalus sanguineus]|uniref:Uncharacterized protein n=1 Tax=Rhipicephalus sanguineus TaxID=34632 RepID=A0A9D4SWH0_RHISA|nr:hypothetical protein HPB52_015409 [Rhipicephalus sanguineus]
MASTCVPVMRSLMAVAPSIQGRARPAAPCSKFGSTLSRCCSSHWAMNEDPGHGSGHAPLAQVAHT